MSNTSRKNSNWMLSNPLYFEISKGSIVGYEPFEVVGERDDIQVTTIGADIWSGTAIKIPTPNQLGGEQISFKSSHHDDRSNGTGLSKLHVHFLKASGNVGHEIIYLNGTVLVDSIGTNIRFINEISGDLVGSGEVSSGNIIAFRKGTQSIVYNQISAGVNMSLSSFRMIPINKTLYLTDYYASASGKQRVFVRLRATSHGTNLSGTTFLVKVTCSLENSHAEHYMSCPMRIPGLTQLKVSAWTGQAGAFVSTGYAGVLVDDE